MTVETNLLVYVIGLQCGVLAMTFLCNLLLSTRCSAYDDNYVTCSSLLHLSYQANHPSDNG